jgi:hypothetical protein
MKLIALVGYAGSGKTSVTAQARVGHGLYIHHMNFSEPIMKMLQALGIPSEILDDKTRWNEPLDLLCGKTIRQAAQTLGTEWGRDQIGPDLWVRAAIARVPQDRHTIIDNLRFPNEMALLKERGAIFIAFERPGMAFNTIHESEKHIRKLQEQCTEGFINKEPLQRSGELFANLLKRILKE